MAKKSAFSFGWTVEQAEFKKSKRKLQSVRESNFQSTSSFHVHTAARDYIYFCYATLRNLWAHILVCVFRSRNTCGPHREVYVFNIRNENSSNVQGNNNLEKHQRLDHFSCQMGPTRPKDEGTPVSLKTAE